MKTIQPAESLKTLSNKKAAMVYSLIYNLERILDDRDCNLIHEIMMLLDGEWLNYESFGKICKINNDFISAQEDGLLSKQDVEDCRVAFDKVGISAIAAGSKLKKHLFLYAIIEYAVENYDADYIEEVFLECVNKRGKQ